MSIEDSVFKRYSPVFEKILNFGFKKHKNTYCYEKVFFKNIFKAVINISSDGTISGTVFDLENNDEYLPIKIKNPEGAFVGEVIEEYKKILVDIRDNCFVKNYFIYPQSNRITRYLIDKYGTEPEFLWDTSPGSGIFRCNKNKKWYLALLDVDRSKLQKGRNGIVEVANIKLNPEEINTLIMLPGFYPAYHMNKKYWLTIVLDDSLPDSEILELISKSKTLCESKHS